MVLSLFITQSIVFMACHVSHTGLVSQMTVVGQFPSCVQTMLCTFLGRPLSLLVERKADSKKIRINCALFCLYTI